MAAALGDTILAANEELLNKQNADAATEYFAQSYVAHLSANDLRGPRSVEALARALLNSFPDLHVKVDILVNCDDRVAWQRTCEATHKADYRGFPASGKTITWRDMGVSRFEDGKIAEDWSSSDLAERLLTARHQAA
jgi:steroid delta-isomerase-like uncharacterized protein